MTKFLTPILIVLLLSSCKTKPEDVLVPKHILGKEQMTALMVDVHLAQAMGFMLRIEEINKEELVRQEYTKVLKVHNVSLTQLTESYDWYIANPVIFDAMYDDIIERIKLQEQFASEHTTAEDSIETNKVKTEEEKRRLFELNKVLPPENEAK